MKRKKYSERIIIILIVLFFAIPVCALALSDSLQFGRGVQPLSYTILSFDNLPRNALIYYRWVSLLADPAFFCSNLSGRPHTPL